MANLAALCRLTQRMNPNMGQLDWAHPSSDANTVTIKNIGQNWVTKGNKYCSIRVTDSFAG